MCVPSRNICTGHASDDASRTVPGGMSSHASLCPTRRRNVALLHESELARTDPDPQFLHRTDRPGSGDVEGRSATAPPRPRPPRGAGPSPGSGRSNGHCSARHGPPCVRRRRSTACGPSTTRGCVPPWRRPDARRHATLPQSWIQRENWEFETHRLLRKVTRSAGHAAPPAEGLHATTPPTSVTERPRQAAE